LFDKLAGSINSSEQLVENIDKLEDIPIHVYFHNNDGSERTIRTIRKHMIRTYIALSRENSIYIKLSDFLNRKMYYEMDIHVLQISECGPLEGCRTLIFYFHALDGNLHYMKDKLVDSIKSPEQLVENLDKLKDLPIRARFYDYAISGTCFRTITKDNIETYIELLRWNMDVILSTFVEKVQRK